MAYKEAVCCVLSSTALAPSIASHSNQLLTLLSFLPSSTSSKLKLVVFNPFWSGEMWQLMVSVKRSLHQRTRHRIADETMVTADGLCRVQGDGPRPSFFRTLLLAPLTLLGCFSPQHIAGEQGMWLSGELARASDRDFLMVRDSMRYAIYV